MTKIQLFLFTAVTIALAPCSFSQERDEGSLAAPAGKGGALGMFSPLASDRPAGALTEISAQREASFDTDKNIAQFSGTVVVKDPQFTLKCDTLTVKLRADRKGIETAEARGKVVIMQEKTDPDSKDERAIGRAEHVVYNPAEGEVVLRGWPSIRQGINNQVATEASTVMTLRADGQSRTTGGSKTVISDTGARP
ncbi:MAG: hypothetical protein KGR46_03975 [Verrucomicrobia bacterium]|nr:hypothetical protein [Verrucomicrobiota bacterium]